MAIKTGSLEGLRCLLRATSMVSCFSPVESRKEVEMNGGNRVFIPLSPLILSVVL